MAEKEIKAKLSRLPLPTVAATQGVNWFLATKPTPDKSYLKLIRAAKTERDLDLVFRNMAFFLFRAFASTRLLNTPALARRVDAINPVSTLGSMQVSIAYTIAEVEKAKDSRLGMAAIWKLRDELYTREGGVNYGTRMLLGYRAAILRASSSSRITTPGAMPAATPPSSTWWRHCRRGTGAGWRPAGL